MHTIPKYSALSKTVTGIALASTFAIALAGGAEEATSPVIATLSEDYKTCIAGAAETTRKFRTLLERKQNEGADTKGLEARMKNIVDGTNEACARIAEQDKTLAELAKKKAEQDKTIVELDKINMRGLEINMELQALDKTLEDFSQKKITREQFRAKTARVPQLVEKIRIQIKHVKQVIPDSKIVAIYDKYESSIQGIMQHIAIINSTETAK